jgi:hypothetical protein
MGPGELFACSIEHKQRRCMQGRGLKRKRRVITHFSSEMSMLSISAVTSAISSLSSWNEKKQKTNRD